MFRRRKDFRRESWALLAVGAGLFLLSTAQARTWTTLEGKKVDAEFVEVVQGGDAVVLDVNGNRFTVPVTRLSPQDRGYIQGLQDAMPSVSDAQLEREIDEAVAEDESGANDNEPETVRLRSRRIWRSREGVAVEAQFVRMVRGTLVLKEGSRYHRIQYYDLSVDDREFVYKAHQAIGKEALVPPVRSDLLDVERPDPEPVPAYRDHPPVPSSQPTSGSRSPPKQGITQSEVKLPGNGFGSVDNGVKLPPTGFGATNGGVKLPPGGFGDSTASNVKLPSSGFGDPSQAKSEASEPGSSVKLPSSGFGNVTPSQDTVSTDAVTQDHGSFTTIPSHDMSRPKVGVPSSTIIDTEHAQPNESDRPLFDVASIPSRSTGFDAMTPSVSSPAETTTPEARPPEKDDSANDTLTNPNAVSDTPSEGNSNSRPQPTNDTSAEDANFNPHTYTPGSDFQPMQFVEEREFTTADWNLQMFGVTLLAFGSLLIAGGYLWLIALAFLESLQVGLRSLIPGMAIVHGITDFDKASIPLLGMLLGICLTLGGFGLLIGVS